MRTSVVLLSVCCASSAWAGGDKVLVDPARAYADESSVWIESGNGDDGALIEAGAEIGGLQKNDRVRLDIKVGGKVVASEKCTFENRVMIEGLDGVNCQDRSKTFKKPGPLQADLIVESDADDKQYLVRTFNVNLKKWGKPDWQIDGDDLLGPAYIIQYKDSQPVIVFWTSGNQSGSAPTLSCKVDGKDIPQVQGEWDGWHDFGVRILNGNKETSWYWSHVAYKTYDDATHTAMHLDKHPGAWDCLMKSYGAVLREFKFTVDSKGKVQQHPMQSAKGAPTLSPSVSQIDMIIPKGNGLDKRIKPDAIKKSRGFGMPWQQHDSVKTLLAALPPALETQSPTVTQKIGTGKMIDGATANPPRFVDESQTRIFTSKGTAGDFKGYTIVLHADVVNVTFQKGNDFRLVVKQKGKEVANTSCGWGRELEEDRREARYGTKTATNVDCDFDDVNFKFSGPLDLQLIMKDDVDGNDYLLRTYKVTVIDSKSWGDPVWPILADDTLGEAWIAGLHPDADHIIFRYWVANSTDGVGYPDVARCTVDGKKLPNDLGLSTTGSTDIKYEVRKQGKDDKVYVYTRYNMESSSGQNGPSVGPGLPPKGEKVSPDQVSYLGQFPGNWECDMRKNGKVLRTLMFHVNDKGNVDPDPLFADELHTPDVAPVRIKFGKDANDVRVRPDVIKKSAGFGRPWPKGAPKDLPTKASGLPDPK